MQFKGSFSDFQTFIHWENKWIFSLDLEFCVVELSWSTDLSQERENHPFCHVTLAMETKQVYFCRLPSLIWPHYPCCDICDSHWL